ncbi:hypothetical protein DFH08DRAFT_881820 [Mycena albidolilacea]|uniref:Secreted protein n=1 Tax=Mycena albidolilacea TaxID=1033008 RepID=A0AAD7ELK9_9AGAR|nr:hypothetical protein DFH08DRAFT_881820 [Mycena albidolilacea]
MRVPHAPQSIVQLILFASASALPVPLVCNQAFHPSTHPYADVSTTNRPPRLRATMGLPSAGDTTQLIPTSPPLLPYSPSLLVTLCTDTALSPGPSLPILP